MSKKTYALLASVLFYIGTFLLLWELMQRTSAGRGLFYFGFPLIVACYFLVAGALFHRDLRLGRWQLWLGMNLIGFPLCWVILTIWRPMLWFNLGMLLIILPVTVILAAVWGLVGLYFLCVRRFKRHAPDVAEPRPHAREAPIHKFSPLYLLLYSAGPILLLVLFFCCFEAQPTLAVGIPSAGIVLWFLFFPTCCQKVGRNLLRKKAEENNLVYDRVFQATDWTLIVDNRHGQLGLLLMWNPFHPYILSVRRVTQVSVDDGTMGKGVLGGTCKVRLLLSLSGKKISLTTFSTNFHGRLGLDSPTVRESIAEAEQMRAAIQQAGQTDT